MSMLEANSFRSVMMIGAAILIGVIFYFMAYVPVVALDVEGVEHYNGIMNEPLPPGTNTLTPYQTIIFEISKTPGYDSDVNHY